MGNCGSNPKTNEEGLENVPKPVTEEVKVDQNQSEANVETTTEETTNDSDNKSLRTLLNQKVEDSPKTEEVKAEEPKIEVVKIEEEKPKAEGAKTEA
ncbi:unnamed protein product [Sphenostylis stenocarpa]|uniref:EKN n=1 Tax=Sphenostylis stenocarpa TaxID=92480 RepID=A0AA86SC23_9FABA|nr:unnamed protein product [Sphenostylis stenocarpa]